MEEKSMIKIKYSKNISWTLLENEVFVFYEREEKIKIIKNVDCDLWIQIQDFLNGNYLWNLKLIDEEKKKILDKWVRQGLIAMETSYEKSTIN